MQIQSRATAQSIGVQLMEALNDEERKTIYTMLDAFIGKKKLKDALSNVLHDVH